MHTEGPCSEIVTTENVNGEFECRVPDYLAKAQSLETASKKSADIRRYLQPLREIVCVSVCMDRMFQHYSDVLSSRGSIHLFINLPLTL